MLCNDPWHLRRHDVWALAAWEVADSYLCPRDKEGRVRLSGDDGEAGPVDEYDLFRDRWRRHGLRDDLIRRLWVSGGGE